MTCCRMNILMAVDVGEVQASGVKIVVLETKALDCLGMSLGVSSLNRHSDANYIL